MDEYWKIVGATPERFQDAIIRVDLNSEVPQGVRSRFEVVKKLIVHGQHVHEFIDVAFEQSLLGFEMALRIRHAKETGGFNNRIDLKDLILWGGQRKMFDQEERSIDALRKMRNIMFHPTDQFVVSLIAFDIIVRIVEIINAMFALPQTALRNQDLASK